MNAEVAGVESKKGFGWGYYESKGGGVSLKRRVPVVTKGVTV